jgi:predicted MFS family arabinose efflux permease
LVATPTLQLHLRLVGAAAFAAMVAMRCCDPMLSALAADFGRSIGDVSVVVSAFAISYGVMQLAYGPIADRIGKLRVITLAALGCAAASGLAAVAQSFDALVLARALMGATAAGIVPMSMAWIGDSVGYADRQETLARLLGATVSGMIAGQWLGGWITEALGWRLVFATLVLLFLTAAVLLGRIAAPTPPPASGVNSIDRGRLGMLGDPRVRWVLGIAAAEGALMFGVLAFAPTFLMQTHGISMAWAAGTVALFGVGGLLYSQLARPLIRRLGERGLAASGGILLGASFLAIGWSGHWFASLPACLIAGVGFYMLHATLQTQATQMVPERRGAAVAWFACLLFLGQSVGISVMSMAMDRGFAAAAIGACGLGLAILGVFVARGVGLHVTAAPCAK